MNDVEWGEYRLGDIFKIERTLSFNTDRLVSGDDYDYVTRTSLNQGILRTTGFVNEDNVNQAGTWSLGLLQMDFFYRKKPWYAGQFVRKITPKIDIKGSSVLFFTALLNKQKSKLLQVLVRNVDEVFRSTKIKLPTKNNQIDFDFMEAFIAELEAQRIAELEAYLIASGQKNYELTQQEYEVLQRFDNNCIRFNHFAFKDIFNNIKQGRRLKKEDQLVGDIPFVMAGVTNMGVVNYISNPVATFPKNSITVDIFGNAFYRNFAFGAGDDTGVYWNTKEKYSEETMLFFAASMGRCLAGKFSYGKKLRSSQSFDFKMLLPTTGGRPDFVFMNNLISAVKKLVIKDVVQYTDRKLEATKSVITSTNKRE